MHTELKNGTSTNVNLPQWNICPYRNWKLLHNVRLEMCIFTGRAQNITEGYYFSPHVTSNFLVGNTFIILIKFCFIIQANWNIC